MQDTEMLERMALDLKDEGFEVLKSYVPGTGCLTHIEVTDTGDVFMNDDLDGDLYALHVNDGTEGAWRE